MHSRYIHRLFRLGFAMLLMLISGLALAQAIKNDRAANANPALSLTYFLDASGQKTADDMARLPAENFKLFTPEKPIAIKNGALWLRFSVTNLADQKGLRLTLPMATVDDASLFHRSADGAWMAQFGGDTRPISTWAQPGRYPSFVLSDERQKPVEYLLKIRHERGLFSIPPRLISESAFITSRQNEHLGLGMYFGLAILVVILALSRALVYRDSGFASYAVYVTLLALSIATISGIAGLYLWPEWPISTIASPLLSTAGAVAADWFVRVVTRPKRFSKLLDRALVVMMCVVPLGGLLTIFQSSGWAYTAYSSVVLINNIVMFSVIIGALWQGDHDSRWVALGFFPILIAVFISVLRNFGLISAGALTELAIPVASAIEAVILFYGLHRRVSQRRSVATRMTRLLQIDPLTGLHTRQVLLKSLAQALTVAKGARQPYALLILHLANADEIEKKYGRETADRVMVQAASCIRSEINPGDTLARVDTAHFALLLESPVTESEANGIATKILANVLRKSSELPSDQALRFRITLGYPDLATLSTKRDAEPILQRLVASAAAMDDGSGKAIRNLSIA